MSISPLDGLQSSTQSTLAQKNKKKPVESDKEQVTVTLAFKRYVYDPCKRMIQTWNVTIGFTERESTNTHNVS